MTTPAALRELADRLDLEVDGVLIDANQYNEGTIGRSDGEKLALLLREAATELRASARKEGGLAVGFVERVVHGQHIWVDGHYARLTRPDLVKEGDNLYLEYPLATQLRTAASEGGEAVAWVDPRDLQGLTLGHHSSIVVYGQPVSENSAPLHTGYTHPPEVARDAGRYRFLRNEGSWSLEVLQGLGSRIICNLATVEVDRIGPENDDFDAAIDAAISGAAGE